MNKDIEIARREVAINRQKLQRCESKLLDSEKNVRRARQHLSASLSRLDAITSQPETAKE